MKSLRVFVGNRLDLLSKELARELALPPASPFEREIIMVQSKGMERWASMQLAMHLGVCGNCTFPFPNAFIYGIFQRIAEDLPEHPILDPGFGTWRIMEILPAYLEREGFEELRSYLQGPDRMLKQLQLSARIAEAFDQYGIYRPEMVERWERGEESHWQAVLWREVTGGHEGEHWPALRKRLLQRIEDAPPAGLGLPERASLFGISYLPPFHLDILQSLSRVMQINVFYLNPCREYWGDIASSRDIRRISENARSAGLTPDELYLEKGNSLLASMGTMGRDFFDALVSHGCEIIPVSFEERADSRFLSMIQSDILNLCDPAGADGERTVLSDSDESIQIQSCHSPMREVEVLYNALLRMFESDSDLAPRDIVVMTPDIETYTPFIQAVFDSPESDSKRVPYSIADRCMRKESRLIDTFLGVLDLEGERITAPQVISILEPPFVRSTFGLTEADMDLILRWVRDVQIKWGVDGESTREWCPSPLHENTWRAGIERLLLGYALPGRDEKLFRGILPYDNVEGSEAAALGSLLAFLEMLFGSLKALSAPRSLTEWADTLSDLAAKLLTPDDDSLLELQALMQVLADMKLIQEVSGFSKAIELPLIRWHLSGCLERGGFGFGFLTGGVTFCSMLPMRSIPFKVICLIGMNENSFPRQSKPVEFNLIARNPKAGDRSVRNEDRYIFLEAILSAADRLYISYTGQSSKDNSTIPSSVLVSELMDYIDKACQAPGEEGASGRLLTKHRLQPFNPAYFKGDTKLFSYSSEHLSAARGMLMPKCEPPPFVPRRLSDPDEAFRTVSAKDLCGFFGNPARYLLNSQLGIYLGEESLLLEDVECFELDGLERFLLEERMVRAAFDGAEADELLDLVKASGKLPHGTPGECTFKSSMKGVERFTRQTEPYIGSGRLEPLDVDLSIGGFDITGRISGIYRDRLVQYRYASIKAKDHLSLWIMHLLMNAVEEPGYPRDSILIGLDGSRKWAAASYSPVENSAGILDQLLGVYWEGLSRPLHFFPQISLKYATDVLQKGKTKEDALAGARAEWERTVVSPYRDAAVDEYLQLCFKSANPIDADFQLYSEMIFGPLIKCREEFQ